MKKYFVVAVVVIVAVFLGLSATHEKPSKLTPQEIKDSENAG